MSTSLAHHLLTMAWNNAWSNDRLLGACALLTDEDYAAPRVSFFPSIRATWSHILTVDWYYVDALERGLAGQPPNLGARAFFDPPEPFATCAPLAEAQRAVDQRLVRATEGLTEADLERPIAIARRVGVLYETTTRLLAHLYQHQIHHRGQIHAMLAGTPVAPPQLDEFFCANEAHSRAAELARLGTAEEAIWGGGA